MEFAWRLLKKAKAARLRQPYIVLQLPPLEAPGLLKSTLSSFSFISGSPSTYVRESPLAQCRSPFGLSGLKESKNTWPRWEAHLLQTISKPPNSETVPTWQPPASSE